MIQKRRCDWCDADSALYVDYHDKEWGVPCADDTTLFQMLVLEGMQAGLSWLTVLKKRASFVRGMTPPFFRCWCSRACRRGCPG